MEDSDKFAREILSEVSRVAKLFEGTQARIADVEKALTLSANPNSPRGSGLPATGFDVGSMFTQSEAFKAAFGDFRADSQDRSYANKSAKADLGLILKAITTDATAIPDKTRLAGIIPQAPFWSSFVFARCAPGTMSGGVLEYVQDTSPAFDPSTPPTAEGQPKPETTPTFALKQLQPKTIAHWVAASKQILADAAALGSFLNAVLLYRLMLRLEYQVVMGDGLTTNMTGLYTAAAAHADPAADVSPFDTIREAIGVVEASGWQVDTVAINPTDWAAMQTERGEDGHYIYANPATSGTGATPIWSKVLVPSPVIPAGEYLVGACGQASQLFEREGANVQAGFQNDNFTRNLVTLLAELRANVAIYATAGFRKGKLVYTAP